MQTTFYQTAHQKGAESKFIAHQICDDPKIALHVCDFIHFVNPYQDAMLTSNCQPIRLLDPSC